MKRQSLATEWQGSRRAPRTLEGNLVKSWPSLSILSVLILQYFGHFWSCSFTKWCKLLCGRSGVTGGSLRCLFHHFHHCRENHESIKTIWRLDATFIYIYMYCMQVFVTFHIFTCSNECTLCWVQGSFWGLPIVAVHWALCFANSNSKIHFSRGQEQGGFSRQMGVYRVVSSSIELFELLQCCIWNELCITLPLTSLRGDCQQRHNHVPYNQRTVGRGVHSNSGPHLRSFCPESEQNLHDLQDEKKSSMCKYHKCDCSSCLILGDFILGKGAWVTVYFADEMSRMQLVFQSSETHNLEFSIPEIPWSSWSVRYELKLLCGKAPFGFRIPTICQASLVDSTDLQLHRSHASLGKVYYMRLHAQRVWRVEWIWMIWMIWIHNDTFDTWHQWT